MPKGIPNAKLAANNQLLATANSQYATGVNTLLASQLDAPSVANTLAQEQAAANAAAQVEALEAKIKALESKLELRMEIRSELNDALRLQQEETKRIAFGKPEPIGEYKMPPKPDEKLVEMKLDRNYAPRGYYEIVGYHKDAVFKKFPDGTTREVEPAEFISGEKKPPAFAGVAFKNKLWAGTVLRFPESEAREIRRNKIGNVELAD